MKSKSTWIRPSSTLRLWDTDAAHLWLDHAYKRVLQLLLVSHGTPKHPELSYKLTRLCYQ